MGIVHVVTAVVFIMYYNFNVLLHYKVVVFLHVHCTEKYPFFYHTSGNVANLIALGLVHTNFSILKKLDRK